MKKNPAFKFMIFMVVFFTAISSAIALPAFLDHRAADKQRQSILKQSEKVLAALYKAEPGSKAVVESSYGYATFSNFGMKIFLAGGGSGRGIAISNKTHQKYFMNMAEIQAGLGLGIKKFMLVWLFENETAFNRFVHSGWELGGQASAAAKAGDHGGAFQGAVAVASGVWLYQLTEAGLALELTAKGTKYYQDNDLNKIGT